MCCASGPGCRSKSLDVADFLRGSTFTKKGKIPCFTKSLSLGRSTQCSAMLLASCCGPSIILRVHATYKTICIAKSTKVIMLSYLLLSVQLYSYIPGMLKSGTSYRYKYATCTAAEVSYATTAGQSRRSRIQSGSRIQNSNEVEVDTEACLRVDKDRSRSGSSPHRVSVTAVVCVHRRWSWAFATCREAIDRGLERERAAITHHTTTTTTDGREVCG